MTLARATTTSSTSAIPFSALATTFVIAIFGLPTLLAAAPLVLELPLPAKLVALPLAPFLWTTAFVLTAGLLSRPFHAAIIPGKFPRSTTHPIYRARRLYGLCWTCLYYNKPAYYLVLTLPFLKRLAFRLFGYRGSLDFTIYPDTWIRDLPLLDFGPGAYIANRATLGTNMALSNGTSLVDRIRIGPGATVGHLAVVAPGVELGQGAELGAGTAIGISARIGEHALVQPTASVNHAARIGARAVVGSASYIGAAAVIEPGASVPPATRVANRSRFAAELPRSAASVPPRSEPSLVVPSAQ